MEKIMSGGSKLLNKLDINKKSLKNMINMLI